MNINKVTSTSSFGNKYNIPRNVIENCPKNRPLLNNEVVDLVKKHSVTSVFSDKGIEVSNPSKEFLDEIIAKGIKIIEAL